MNQKQPSYQTLQKDCEEIVTEGIKLLVAYQKKFKILKMKDPMDMATTADLAAEKQIVRFITKKYPAHSIYSEEIGAIDHQSDYTWFIDPLDGTKEFVRGLAEFNCLAAVEYKGKLVAGAAYRNGFNELYSTSRTGNAWLNGKKLHVSRENDVPKSFVGYHFPAYTSSDECIKKNMRIAEAVIRQSYRIRPGWDDAKLLGYVARGAIEGCIISDDLKIGWYDVAPTILLVEEAGGRVTDWEGNDIADHDAGRGIVASNGKIHERLLDLIGKERI